MQKIKILIIEDEHMLAMKMRNSLEFAGYEVAGIAASAESALQLTQSGNVDVIIADINIKGELNGIETVELIQKSYNIPVIFLTAFHDDNTLKAASKVNFTGYIVKPYLEEQLLREVKLAAFRYGLNRSKELIELGNGHHFNTAKQELYSNGETVTLRKQELALLQLLVQNIDQVVSIEAVEMTLWYDKVVSENARRKLLHSLRSSVSGLEIETIKGVGYKLNKGEC